MAQIETNSYRLGNTVHHMKCKGGIVCLLHSLVAQLQTRGKTQCIKQP
jgi:hypothetical protein